MGGVKFGLIKVGIHMVSIYENNGVRFDNEGIIIFRGHCNIGSGSGISVGKEGCLMFGKDFQATHGLKIVCYNKIVFGNNVLIGWNNLFTDTNFHNLSDYNGGIINNHKNEILIGSDCWFGFNCTTMPGAKIPNKCVIASNSLINKKYFDSYCLYAGMPAAPKKYGIWHSPE